jgi:hypothetical protein
LSYKRLGWTPLPRGRKKESLTQGRLEHNTTQFSRGRRVLRSGGSNHVNHRVHRVHLELTTKRLKAFPTKEPQRAAPVATPVEVSQNHFDRHKGQTAGPSPTQIPPHLGYSPGNSARSGRTGLLPNLGVYSSKSEYDRLLMGVVQFKPSRRIWGAWAPPRCKFFVWLASLNRCWTADRLARQGLDHPLHCLLCEQEEENVQHIMVGCVFSREVWFQMLSLVGLQRCTPKLREENFQEWWRTTELKVPKQVRAGFNSLVSLNLWCL